MSLHWPSLTAARRKRDFDALSAGEVIDVLVIGGGITGVGAALDAASRGLSVALVEQNDLGSGTSGWSSKLIHGGLRYLANGDISVAHESAVERGILMQRTAPHLTRPLPMVFSSVEGVSNKDKALARIGFRAGDLLRVTARTKRSTLPGPRQISAAEARALVPCLPGQGLSGGILSFDGQLEDDVRLVLAVARTAAAYGARIIPRASARWIAGDGAQIRDALTGMEFRLKARAVINATGVWAGGLEPAVRLRPSRGSHLIVKSSRLGFPRAALTVPVAGETGRYAFVLPQSDGLSFVGITDVPIDELPEGQPRADAAEIDFLLKTINVALDRPLHYDDILGTYSGLRPLLDDGQGVTADLSRKHSIIVGDTGAVTVLGGKLTTYRKMAQDAVNRAIEVSGLWASECRTREIQLVGAASPERLANVLAPERLVRRYGVEAEQVLALGDQYAELGKPISPDIPTTVAEMVWGLKHELAMTAEDLVDRRTRVGLVPAYREVALEAAHRAMDIAEDDAFDRR